MMWYFEKKLVKLESHKSNHLVMLLLQYQLSVLTTESLYSPISRKCNPVF